MTEPPVSPAEQERRDDLAVTALGLKDEVARLRLQHEQLERRTGRAERKSGYTMWGAVALLAVVVVLGLLLFQQQQTANRLESLTQRAFCPVYGLVVGGYNPDTRPLNPDGSYPGSAREKYDATFRVMRDAYAELVCLGGTVPPRQES